jgi:hypothetical protein
MAELTAYKISRMKKHELFKAAAAYGCDITADTKRPEIIKALLDKIKTGQQPQCATVETNPGNKRLFEELTEPAPETAESGEPEAAEPAKRGGFRPGAGRKPGVTVEMSRIDNLPVEPNRTVEYVVKWLFKSWSILADCKEIALDDEELREFSVDTTQFLEYHGIRIPQGLAVDGKFILGGCELVGSRLMIHKAHKHRIKQQEKKNENSDDKK